MFLTYIFSWWNISWILLDENHTYGRMKKINRRYDHNQQQQHDEYDYRQRRRDGGNSPTKKTMSSKDHGSPNSQMNYKLNDMDDDDDYTEGSMDYKHGKHRFGPSSSIYKEKVTEIVYPRDYREYHKRMFISMVSIQNSSSLLMKNDMGVNAQKDRQRSNKNTDGPNKSSGGNEEKNNDHTDNSGDHYKHVPQFSIELTKYHKDSIETRAFSHFLLLCADHLYKEDSDSIGRTLTENKKDGNNFRQRDQRSQKDGEDLHKQLLYCGDKLMSRSSVHCSLTYPIEYLQIQPNNEKIVDFLNLLIQKSLNKCQLLWFLKK